MDNPTEIIYLNPRDLMPSRQNVRSDPGDLAGLAETIREHGILQPLGIAREDDAYRIVYGHRRRDAAIVVGLDRVPCLVVHMANDADAVVQQVLENLQRLDLNDLDKSRAFEGLQKRITDSGLNQTEALELMARTLGLSARQIQRYLRLRQLSPIVQRSIAQGDLGVTHGQHLADIEPIARQEAVAELAVEEGLSAAELSRLCVALRHNANIDPLTALESIRRGEDIAAIEERPRETLTRFSQPPVREAADGGAWDGKDGDGKADTLESRRTDARDAPLEDRLPWDSGGSGTLEPTTRDGNRVRKIHSLDSFMDEVQRLASCVQEGDLQRMLGDSDGASVKIKLAARQLRFLSDAVSALARSTGS